MQNAFLSRSKEKLVSKLRSKDTPIFTHLRLNMSKMIKSKKYQGVYHRQAKSGGCIMLKGGYIYTGCSCSFGVVCLTHHSKNCV